MTSLSEQTKKVVKLNTEDHEPEDIERGMLYINESLPMLGGSLIKNGCTESISVIFSLVKIILRTIFFILHIQVGL